MQMNESQYLFSIYFETFNLFDNFLQQRIMLTFLFDAPYYNMFNINFTVIDPMIRRRDDNL